MYYSTMTYCYWGFLHYIKYMKLHQTHEMLHNLGTAGSRTNRSAMLLHPSRPVTLSVFEVTYLTYLRRAGEYTRLSIIHRF